MFKLDNKQLPKVSMKCSQPFVKILKINKSNIALNNKVQRGVWFLDTV